MVGVVVAGLSKRGAPHVPQRISMMSFVTQSEIEGSKEMLELAGWPPGGGITFQPTTGSILLHGMYPVEMHLPIPIQHLREVR
jgi:hypothetical protein